QQAKLRKSRVGIDHDAATPADRFTQIRPDRKPLAKGPATSILNRQVLDPNIAGEQFVRFLRARKVDLGIWGRALGGIERNAGNGDVGAESHPREHEHVARLWTRHSARPANSPVTGREVRAVQIVGQGLADYLGKQVSVDITETRLEEVGQTLHD